MVSACRQLFEAAVMVFKVKAPATVTAPLNLEMPSTPKVVVGRLVPIPTRFSLAFTTRVLSVVSTMRPDLKELVAVAESTIWNRVVGAAWSEMKFKRFPV